MPESIDQKDSFTEKNRLLNIALKFTNGDMERAKFMVSGQYDDVKIIKGKFDIEEKNTFGLLLIFINHPNKYIMHLNSIITSNEAAIARVSIFDSWKTFYTDLTDISNNEEEIQPSYEFLKYISGSLDNHDIYSDIEVDNLERVTAAINDILNKFFLSKRGNCQINIDNSSSLNLELANIPIEGPEEAAGKEETDKPGGKYADKIAEIESKADYVLDGRIIISPVKGKHISEVKSGEKIKILLTGNKTINKQIAKSLNALSEDNEILPLNMRITEKFPMEKKGFYIYGLIAKNVLVRIIEEEDVKIETDSIQKTAKSSKAEKNNPENRTVLYLVLLIGILLMSFLLIIFLI